MCYFVYYHLSVSKNNETEIDNKMQQRKYLCRWTGNIIITSEI